MPPSSDSIAGLMCFSEVYYITRAILLLDGARRQHVTVLQSTSSHDHSRVRQTQINVDFIPQLQSTTGRAGFILDCEILFMPDHSEPHESQEESLPE